MGQLVSTDWLCHDTAEWHLHHHGAARIRLKHRGAENKKHCLPCLMQKSVSVCLSASPSPYTSLSVELLRYMILLLSPYMSVHSWLLTDIFFVLVSTCFSVSLLYALFSPASPSLLFPLISPSHICPSSNSSAYLSSLCVLFVRLEVKHVLH